MGAFGNAPGAPRRVALQPEQFDFGYRARGYQRLGNRQLPGGEFIRLGGLFALDAHFRKFLLALHQLLAGDRDLRRDIGSGRFIEPLFILNGLRVFQKDLRRRHERGAELLA